MPGTQEAAAWGFKGWKRGFGATIPSPGQPVWERCVVLCWLPPGGPFIPHGIISFEGFVNCSASSSPPPHGAGGPRPATCYRIQTSRLGLETDLFILGLGGCFPQPLDPKYKISRIL